MPDKSKTKKCQWKPCGKEFTPKTEWQKFDDARCRNASLRAKNSAFIKRARKIMDAQPGK